MRILIFGTGKIYSKYKSFFDGADVLALIDNDDNKIGQCIDEKVVIAPNEIIDYEYDYIYILVRNSREIFRQLLAMGVLRKKIRTYMEITVANEERHVYLPDNIKVLSKRVIIVSNELIYSGVPMCVRMCADVLIKNNYDVIVVSRSDGPLREALIRRGVTVVVDSSFRLDKISYYKEMRNASFVIVNSIMLYYMLTDAIINIPVFWWIHESKRIYEGRVYPELLQGIDWSNTYLYYVSEYAHKDVSEVIARDDYKLLMLGVMDIAPTDRQKIQEICFITVGAITPRKGQDVLTEAIKLLPKPVLSNSCFYYVGTNSNSDFEQNIKDEIVKNNLPIKLTGQMSNDEVLELLNNSDCLICPSREETVSIAIVEALRAERTVIASSETGAAAYLTDGDNALVFESENPKDLARKIEFILDNREKSLQMASKGRKVYETIFSEEAFEKRLLREIERVMNNRNE